MLIPPDVWSMVQAWALTLLLLCLLLCKVDRCIYICLCVCGQKDHFRENSG